MKLEFIDAGLVFPDGKAGFSNLSMSIGSDSFTVLTGKNGSGKTLLARTALGLERLSSGKILLDGQKLDDRIKDARRRIGFVFQEPEHQILGITVGEDLRFGLRGRGWSREEISARSAEMVALTGLGGMEDQLCASLSGGEKRRLAIASALVSRAELLILDEPFNDLDWDGSSMLLELLLDLREKGIGIFVISHDLEKCLAHADRLIVMDAGKIVADGSPEKLWDELPALGLRRPKGGPALLKTMTWLREGQ